MLTQEIVKKISDFVFLKPRTIDEIAKYIKKNWRTANRYVEKIEEQQGTIAIRTFRKGTRGALKIVYWRNIEQIHNSAFQQQLFEDISRGRHKEDFNPFDIWQHVDPKKKSAFLEEQEEEGKTALNKDIPNLLKSAEKQVLIFSGNLSWANLIKKDVNIYKILEELGKQNISVKILTRVDVASLSNIKKFMAINNRVGKGFIEIRHREQPLRSFIIDDRIARFKEIKNKEDYNKRKLKKKTYVFYDIYDPEWVEWIQKVFWNMFSASIPAEKRIKEIERIHKLR